jgi:A/G-specific adenine glycosylase
VTGSWTGPLMRWYGRNRKPLAWRDDPRPYRVWVGEVMSQQTTLAVAVPRFGRFVARIPDVRALARCPEKRLRSLWSGLGYYARARNLVRGARYIVDQRGCTLPTNRDGWLAVPGCGPYTSAVIASMCFGQKVHCIDGNVIRVWSRMNAIAEDPRSSAVAAAMNRDLGQRIRTVKRPGDFNQGIMQLGQEVCTRHSPGCGFCPIRRHCQSLELGTVETCPPTRPRARPVDVKMTVIIGIEQATGRVMIGRRTSGFLAGTVGFPLLEGDEITIPGTRRAGHAGRFDHVITNHRIHASVVVVKVSSARHGIVALASQLGVADPELIEPTKISGSLSSALDLKALATT